MSDHSRLDWRKSNVLVTGANGFLGFALVRGLAARGAHVHAIVNKQSYDIAPFCFNIKEVIAIPCDVSDLSSLRTLFVDNSFDVVIHLAAINRNTSLVSPYSLWESNIRGTYTILEACRLFAPDARIIIASSREADSCFDSSIHRRYHPYMVSKAADELIAFSYRDCFSLAVSCVRTDNIYGEGDRNLQRLIPSAIMSILKGKSPVIKSDGKILRSYIYVEDVVNAYCAVAEQLPSSTITANPIKLSAGSSISALDLVHLLISISDNKNLSPTVLNKDLHERIDAIYDSALEKKLLKWECATPFRVGLTRTFEWYKSHVPFLSN